MITSVLQAVELLDDASADTIQREMAAHYLEQHPDRTIVQRMVSALEDNDPGVRWASAEALSKLGQRALIDMLMALMDPTRVGNPLLREGVYHALHHNLDPKIPAQAHALMQALRGPVPDLASMEEAFYLLREIREENRNRFKEDSARHREAPL
jgi:HEAT repeat protein